LLLFLRARRQGMAALPPEEDTASEIVVSLEEVSTLD
jgi:hypothetical protein